VTEAGLELDLLIGMRRKRSIDTAHPAREGRGDNSGGMTEAS